MDNPLLYQVVGVLLILFFLFLTYMFTKTWRVWHVICTFLVFGAAVAFAILSAASYRTHATHRAAEKVSREERDKLQKDHDDLMFGDPTAPESPMTILSLSAELGRALLDRSRVWDGCAPQGVQADDSALVNTTVAGAEPGRLRFQPQDDKMVVYVYVELPIPGDFPFPTGAKVPPPGSKVPAYYVGEFSVGNITETTVTLRPTIPLDAIQKGLLRQTGVTWSLFETLPVDGHRFFAVNPDSQPNYNESADIAPVFGDMNKEMLAKLFPPPPRLPTFSDEVYQRMLANHEAMLDRYARDGRRALQTDLPEDTWMKVQFTAEHTVDVDSDASLGGINSSPLFFNLGRAEVPFTRRGSTTPEPAKFKVGDIGIFPRSDAETLIAEGKCKEVEPIYVRPLNNYEFIFRTTYQRVVELVQEIARIERNRQESEVINAQTVAQIDTRTKERDQLRQDKVKFDYEAAQIAQYHAALQATHDDLRSRLSRLYNTNLQLAAELARVQQQMADEINRRTLNAVSGPTAAPPPSR